MDHTPEMPNDRPPAPPIVVVPAPPVTPPTSTGGTELRARVTDLLVEVLDGLDRLGDRIAGAAGLR